MHKRKKECHRCRTGHRGLCVGIYREKGHVGRICKRTGSCKEQTGRLYRTCTSCCRSLPRGWYTLKGSRRGCIYGKSYGQPGDLITEFRAINYVEDNQIDKEKEKDLIAAMFKERDHLTEMHKNNQQSLNLQEVVSEEGIDKSVKIQNELFDRYLESGTYAYEFVAFVNGILSGE
jgi:hypothetical protein